MANRTLSAVADTPRREARRGAWLFHVLTCDDVARPTAGFALADLNEVELGRGGGGARRAGRRVAIQLDDARVSELHARLTRELAGWLLTDAGSKNGTLVNGERAARALLEDGDVIEIGQTFLRFRADLPAEEVEMTPDAPTLLPTLREDLRRLALVAPSTAPVIILGESGTGKEGLARAVHAWSARRGPLVAVNCGAIPANLVESHLFGHKRGAFSGALEDHVGLVRSADGGTLFLDEIGDLPRPAQTTLLRVLQEGEVLPVGAARPVQVSLRVVSATHRDLSRLVAEGEFRHDLYNRLAAFQITLPPLRDRLEDFGLLLRALVAARASRPASLHPSTARCMLAHGWPGNIRELEKVLEAAAAMAQGQPILPEHLPPAIVASLELPLGVEEARHRDELVALLKKHKGNIAAVGRDLGKARNQVHRWLRRYALDIESFR